MSQPHPCPSPCLFLSIFLLSNLALSLLISPAHAQLLEKQTKLIGTLVQNNVFSGSTNFDSIQLELSKDDVRELDENDEWTMLAELGTFGYCTIQTQQARLTSIRRVSYQVNVKVVGASLENDTTPRVWYPVIDRLGESDPMKKDFRRCVLPGEKEVVVGENRLDFAKLTGYEKRKNAANALVKKKSAPFVGISTFADSCHEFKSRQIWTPCSRVASELEEKKAVEGVVEPPLRNVIPSNTDFYYVAYESETIVIELVTAVALSMELALVASILHKFRRLRPFEWLLILIVMLATLFTASFSVYGTIERLSPIETAWLNMAMTNVYLTANADFVVEMVGTVSLVSSQVAWTSKLIILPIVAIALVVFMTILVLIYRRVRNYGIFAPGSRAEVDSVLAELYSFRMQQKKAKATKEAEDAAAGRRGSREDEDLESSFPFSESGYPFS